MAHRRYAVGGGAFVERTEEQIEQRRSGRVQDQDLDFPRRIVPLAGIDAAVAKHYRVDPRRLSAHGRSVGPAKAVAVELVARRADMTGRAIGEHYGVGATAVGAIHRRLAAQPKRSERIRRLRPYPVVGAKDVPKARLLPPACQDDVLRDAHLRGPEKRTSLISKKRRKAMSRPLLSLPEWPYRTGYGIADDECFEVEEFA